MRSDDSHRATRPPRAFHGPSLTKRPRLYSGRGTGASPSVPSPPPVPPALPFRRILDRSGTHIKALLEARDHRVILMEDLSARRGEDLVQKFDGILEEEKIDHIVVYWPMAAKT